MIFVCGMRDYLIKLQAMTVEKRGTLKSMFLLPKCEVRLHILGPSPTFPRTLYNILSIQNYEDKETEQEIEQMLAEY